MAVMLAALRTGRALPPETLFLCFCYSFLLEAERALELMWPEGLGKLKKFIHLIGSRTRDLLACSIVP
jgi:hypothetical protein